MPSVPGGLHIFVESVDQILQRHLAQSQLYNRSVHLRSGEDGSLEIVVDSTVCDDLDQVEDKAVRDLIQGAVDEWQGNYESSVNTRWRLTWLSEATLTAPSWRR